MMETNIHTDFYMSGPTTALTDLMPVGEVVRNVRNGVYVLLVLSGTARIKIDGVSYELLRGCVVTIFPFHTMSSEWKAADFCFEYLYFGFDFTTDFPLMLPPEEAERLGVHPCRRADDDGFAALERCYNFMQGYYQMQEHPLRTGIVKAQLLTFVSELLFRCTNSIGNMRITRSVVLTDGFFQLLHRYYKTEHTLAFYADSLCVTTKYLSKVVRRTTDHTVYFWIEEFMVKEAKLLLRSTQATITEIAEQLNFPNSSFFAKFFRRHTGLSPVEFRRSF